MIDLVRPTPPTQAQLWEDEEGDLTTVDRKSEDDWRHGCTIEEVFLRDSDQTYWWVSYRRQTDGEYDGLRDNDYVICQVEPYETTVIEYRSVR